MAEKHPKRPRDLNQWAKHMVDLATGVAEPTPPEGPKVAAGRAGGLKGGKARAAKMTAAERLAAAQKANKARWSR